RRADAESRLEACFLPGGKPFFCVSDILDMSLAEPLIADYPLIPDSLGNGPGPPVSLKELHYRELNWVNEDTKPDSKECEQGDAIDAKMAERQESEVPVWWMMPAARRNKQEAYAKPSVFKINDLGSRRSARWSKIIRGSFA